MKRALITGSSGLVGGECAKFLCGQGFAVFGVDRDLRHRFAGHGLASEALSMDGYPGTFAALNEDIRDREGIERVFRLCGPFDLIIHAAGQPVHDWATDNAIEDFEINAVGTMVMLENYRRFSPDSVFLQVSSSKVYGGNVTALPLVELDTRFELDAGHRYYDGIDESMSIDQAMHSLFGSSKAAADLAAQEYGRFFGLKVAVFRPVTIAGPTHRGTKSHGYLSYLVRCLISGDEYIVNGFKGKQVRDNLHVSDLVSAFWQVYLDPTHTHGEVYNIGAGRHSHNSILEAIAEIEAMTGRKGNVTISEKPRHADWRWCVFNTDKFRRNYPSWSPRYDNRQLLHELTTAWNTDVNSEIPERMAAN